MKLEYTILWFDDQPDNLRDTAQGIKDRIAREGFELCIKWVPEVGDSAQEIAQLQEEGDFDLILMDLNLGEGKDDGAKLAKRVRAVFRYTEILFYSAASPKDLRTAIFEQGIDGVYCVHRNGLDLEVMGVFDTTIQKALDLNGMRGLVMAEVSNLDHAIDKCLRTLYYRVPKERKDQLVAEIVKQIKVLAERNMTQAQDLAGQSFDKLIRHRAFSSSLKHQVLQNEISEFGEEIAAVRLIEKLSLYHKEVIEHRNTLAHEQPVMKKGTLVFPDRNLAFTKTQMSTLRRDLIAHQTNLADLHKLILHMHAKAAVPVPVEAATNVDTDTDSDSSEASTSEQTE